MPTMTQKLSATALSHQAAQAYSVITGIGVRTDRRGGLVYAGYTWSI